MQPYILIAIGLLAIVYSLLKKSQNASLKQTGKKVQGIIFDKDANRNPVSFYSTTVKFKVTIRFVTEKKEWITADISQDFATFFTGQYKQGNKVIVYYDESNPQNFYVDTKQSEFVGRLIISLIGILFICTGLYRIFF